MLPLNKNDATIEIQCIQRLVLSESGEITVILGLAVILRTMFSGS